jgi:hypothetical protein
MATPSSLPPTLMGLPAEIRDKIYRHLYADLGLEIAEVQSSVEWRGDTGRPEDGFKTNPPHPFNTLAVSRQMRKETLSHVANTVKDVVYVSCLTVT